MATLEPSVHHEAIGEIVANAANADLILFNTFWRISGCDLATATSIYYVLEALPVRTRMIRKIASHACKPNGRSIIEEIIDAVECANKQRRIVAHSAKVLVGDQQLTVNPRNIMQPTSPITAATFKPIIEETKSQMHRAAHAYEGLCHLLGVSPELSVAQGIS